MSAPGTIRVQVVGAHRRMIPVQDMGGVESQLPLGELEFDLAVVYRSVTDKWIEKAFTDRVVFDLVPADEQAPR